MGERSISRRGMRDGRASVEHRLDVRFEIVSIDKPAGVRRGYAAFFVDEEGVGHGLDSVASRGRAVAEEDEGAENLPITAPFGHGSHSTRCAIGHPASRDQRKRF